MLLLLPGPRRSLRRRIERSLPVPVRGARGSEPGGRHPDGGDDGGDVVEGEVLE
jgi:hypothetical protein